MEVAGKGPPAIFLPEAGGPTSCYVRSLTNVPQAGPIRLGLKPLDPLQRTAANSFIRQGGREMRHLVTVISIVLASNLGPAIAQNTLSPKPEDAEKNAFETPTAGKSATDTLKNTKDQSSERNPESRLNDDRQPPEGSPKRPEK